MKTRPIPIPIVAARAIADLYDYDQVIIVARKVGEQPSGEHVTTYGRNKIHCDIAAKIGDFLKYKIIGWVRNEKDAELKPPSVEKDNSKSQSDYLDKLAMALCRFENSENVEKYFHKYKSTWYERAAIIAAIKQDDT